MQISQEVRTQIVQYSHLRDDAKNSRFELLFDALLKDLKVDKSTIKSADSEDKFSLYFELRDVVQKLLGSGTSQSRKLVNLLEQKLTGRQHSSLETVIHDLHEMNSFKLSYVLESLNKNVSSKVATDLTEQLGLVMFYSAVYGGLCNEKLQQALVTKLQTEANPFIAIEGRALIVLSIESQVPNYRNQDGAFERRFWYPDAASMAAILGFLRMKNWEAETTPKKSIKAVFSKFHSRYRSIERLSLNQFFASASRLMATLPHAAIPPYLLNYCNGTLTSSSTTLKSLAAAFGVTMPSNYDPALDQIQVEDEVKTKVKVDNSYSDHDLNVEAIMDDLRFITREFNEDGTARIHPSDLQYVKFELKQLNIKHEGSLALEILLDWLHSNINNGKWRISTASRAVGAIAESWLIVADRMLDENLDAAQVDLIREAILIHRGDSDSKSTSHLNYILEHANSAFNISLPDSLEASTSPKFVVTDMLSEREFQLARKHLFESLVDESSETQKQFDLMFILLYRLFLRPAELVGIRLKDIEISEDAFVTIRNTVYNETKTLSAIRQLPIGALLLEDEYRLFKDFLSDRLATSKRNKTSLVFSKLEGKNKPFTVGNIRAKIRPAMCKAAGRPIRLYQLRHSGGSICQIVFLGSENLQKQLTPYTQTQIARIKHLMSSADRRNNYTDCSTMMGHINPNTTMSTYNHFTDLLLFEALSKSDYEMPTAYWRNLSQNSLCTLTLNQSPEVLGSHTVVKRLIEEGSEFFESMSSDETQSKPLDKVIHESKKITYELCNKVLTLVDKNLNVGEIAQKFQVDEKVVMALIESAKSIKQQFVTTRKMPRLFPASFQGVCPIPVKRRSEVVLVKELNKNIRRIPDKKFDFLANSLLNNTSHNRSLIRFDCPSEFKSCMALLDKLIGKSLFKLELEPLQNSESPKLQLHQWRDSKKVTYVIKDKLVRRPSKYPHGRGSLVLMCPMAKTNAKQLDETKEASNALQHTVHVNAIIRKAELLLAEKANQMPSQLSFFDEG